MSMRSLSLPLALALSLVIDPSSARANEPRMVADLETEPAGGSALPVANLRAAALGDRLLFEASSHRVGSELWVTDGTPAGTRQVLDLRPGIAGSEPRGLTVFGGEVFFVAEDGALGRELWASDGTAAGTRLVADLCPGPCDGIRDREPRLARLGDRLYFAASDGLSGDELWRTDGTAAGTEQALDLCPGGCDACPSRLVATADRVFFVAADEADGDYHLWGSDGTPEGTRRLGLSRSGVACQRLSNFQGYPDDDRLFFTATDATGRELWVAGGRQVFARRVLDLCPGGCSGVDQLWGAFGGRAIVRGRSTERAGPADLLAIDARGTSEVLAGAGNSPTWPSSSLTVLDGRFYFVSRANLFGSGILVLSRSDGTAAGTSNVTTLAYGDSGEAWLTASADHLFVALQPCRSCDESATLWRSDGSASGTQKISTLSPASPAGYGAPITHLVAAGERLFFAGRRQPEGDELWTSDGTAEGTAPLGDLYDDPGSSRPGRAVPFSAVGERFLFEATPHQGVGVYASDGTPEGTRHLEEGPTTVTGALPLNRGLLYSGYGVGLWWTDGERTLPLVDATFSSAHGLATTRDALYFAAWGYDGIELWRSDGTDDGTVQVADIDPRYEPAGHVIPDFAPLSSRPSDLVRCPPGVLFAASDAAGRELWFSDGSEEGTVQREDLCPGECSSDPAELTIVGPVAVFAATTPDLGRELWASNGMPDGTHLVGDLLPGPAGSSPRRFLATGSRVFFLAAADDTDGVWATDGSAGGTRLLAPLRLLAGGGVRAAEMVLVDGRFYLTAYHPTTGIELWTSDGTPEGTRLVVDLFPGPVGSHPTELTTVPGGVVFAADGGDGAGRELWISDGTAGGTRRLTDLAPGELPSQPEELVAQADRRLRLRLLFRADDGVHGIEPWQIELEDELPARPDTIPPVRRRVPLPTSPGIGTPGAPGAAADR